VWQSQRGALYQRALDQLLAAGWAYPCACTRRDIADALAALGRPKPRFAEAVYPGTCRAGLHGRPARALRLRTLGPTPQGSEPICIAWHDRRLGAQTQDLTAAVGDFVLRRADGLWAYQLAVVVDDAEQGITDVVRGEDLADNTARQIHLQRCLGLAMPTYLHLPLVLGVDGHKLSKQNGAAALDTRDPLAALRAAARVLGLPELPAASMGDWLAAAVQAWAAAWPAKASASTRVA
jgi:glutamyl-Q tRNA(Asp) synthetase